MLHLRVVVPDDLADDVLGLLRDRTGVVAVVRVDGCSDGPMIEADIARETVDDILDDLHEIGVKDRGMIALDTVDTALGELADRAEREAPGEGDDAVIWDELTERLEADSTLTWTFLGFMTLATILGGIGVVTDSTVTVVGAMVLGPDFGPLAGIAVGLVRRRPAIVKRATVALVVGFVAAIVVTFLLSLIARGTGLISAGSLQGRTQTDFVYHPGWFSLITAVVAGIAGILSLTSSRSTALVGVFISVTTIPAAGNAAVALAVGNAHEWQQSLLQLLINLVGISAAGAIVLWIRRRGEDTLVDTHRTVRHRVAG